MAASVHPDSAPAPGELPADAVAVIYWEENEHPHRYKVAAIVTGAKLDEAVEATVEALPHLAGAHVRATKIGGKSSEGGRAKVRERLTRTVTVEPEPEGDRP